MKDVFNLNRKYKFYIYSTKKIVLFVWLTRHRHWVDVLRRVIVAIGDTSIPGENHYKIYRDIARPLTLVLV